MNSLHGSRGREQRHRRRHRGLFPAHHGPAGGRPAPRGCGGPVRGDRGLGHALPPHGLPPGRGDLRRSHGADHAGHAAHLSRTRRPLGCRGRRAAALRPAAGGTRAVAADQLRHGRRRLVRTAQGLPDPGLHARHPPPPRDRADRPEVRRRGPPRPGRFPQLRPGRAGAGGGRPAARDAAAPDRGRCTGQARPANRGPAGP